MGRLCALAIVSGAVLVQSSPRLPALADLYAACLGLASFLVLLRLLPLNKPQTPPIWLNGVVFGIWRTATILLALLLSVTWTTWRAEQRLSAVLSLEHENVVTRLSFRVTSLPNDTSESVRFEAQVLEPLKAGVPIALQISWLKTPTMPRVLPGQVFRAALVLRRPHSNLNPQGFDYEGHLFAKNIRALGRVRGTPVLLADQPFATFSVAIARARHLVREGMRRVTAHMTYGAVLIALAIGDQDSVKQEHWQVFNLTGITHLVSISGSHVTMLAALGGWLALLTMKRARWRGRLLCERLPARVVATLAAMFVAWLYCLLAGWGVPAQRTFFMLTCVAASILVRHTLSASRVLALAAAVVVVVDPWAPVSTGFWLSFLAVGILFAAGAAGDERRPTLSRWQSFKQLCTEASRLQWLITIAMLPVLAFLFQQVSLVSPFANALAIPVLTFVVTPLALALALFGLVPGLSWLATASGVLAHWALESTMIPVTLLANLSWASFDVAAAPSWTIVLAVVGLCWALQPPGWPARWAGWCLLLPVLSFAPQRPASGHWRLLAFDVGQGGAVLLQTQTHDVLFDTGPRQGTNDAGMRTLLPNLRALGVGKLDSVVVSHADSDHAGGLLTVLNALPVGLLYSSFSFQEWLKRASSSSVSASLKKEPTQVRLCERGQRWVWDGVVFQFLHPEVKQSSTKSLATKPATVRATKSKPSKNAQSCVLYIQGAYHSALLPGDIGVKQEELLLDLQLAEQPASERSAAKAADAANPGLTAPNTLKADLVVVAHHGSATSSSVRFVQQLRAQHAIAQTGYLNRFGHPHPVIRQRWLEAQTTFWHTDHHGAILAESSLRGLIVQNYSQLRQRYWHRRSP
jgi:competence protein ComEC